MTTHKKKYKEYLKTPQWKQIKQNLLLQRGSKCQTCGKTKTLQIHHLTYKRVFNELPEDLMILCAKCHEHTHKKKHKTKKRKLPQHLIYQAKLNKLINILTAGVISEQTYINTKKQITELKQNSSKYLNKRYTQ